MLPLLITFAFLSYLYGSLPFALINTFLIKKKNLLFEGTGNIGVINAFRTGGTSAGILTVIGEISKAFFPIGMSFFLFDYEFWITLTFVFLTLLGTNFSVFLKFRGGHGTTMTFYSTLVLSPFAALSLLAINTIFHLFSRYDFRIKRLWNIFLPPIIFLFERFDLPFQRSFQDDILYTCFAAATAILFILRSGESQDDYVRHFEEYEMSKRKKVSIKLHKLSPSTRIPFIGNKASNLEFLLFNKIKVPRTYVLDWYLSKKFVEDGADIRLETEKKILKKISMEKYYAVRSSTSIEDHVDFSFAGQFETILNVQGIDDLKEAIKEVYNSKDNERSKNYLSRSNLEEEDLKMAIIIQEMIQPLYSGVSFGKNPITGLDEIVIEAVQGSGELLVQDGITPFSWVYKWGEILSEPEEKTLPSDIIHQIAETTLKIQKRYGKPVDLEWIYDGKEVFWVQLRPITTFSDLNIYSNKFSKEFLPGIIKPLIFSINIPLINSAWIKILTELVGNNELDPYQLAKSLYYRAYFNLGRMGQIFEAVGFPNELLEILIFSDADDKKPKFKITPKTLKHLPRVIKFLISKLFFFERRIKIELQTLLSEYSRFEDVNFGNKSPKAIIEDIEELFELNKEVAYFNIVIPLLNFFFSNRLIRKLKKYNYVIENLDYQLNYDQELSDYDPNYQLAVLNDDYKNLDSIIQNQIREGSYENFLKLSGIESFRKKFLEFIRKFGHLSDSGNDFSTKTWKEQPDKLLQMVIDFEEPSSKIAKSESLPYKQIRSKSLLSKVKRYRFFKEKMSFDYTCGYNLFREYFSALAIIFVKKGVITDINDIYYLRFEEIKEIVENNFQNQDKKEQVAQIKAEIEKYRDVVVPTTVYGDDLPPISSVSNKYHKLVGRPSSPGYFTGKITKVNGIEEFDKLQQGDVLVIPYSDVAWTPIILKAGALISESGGMLSHCSIVAREYNIPAVVSVDGISQLKDGYIVSVDGYKGEIKLIERISENN